MHPSRPARGRRVPALALLALLAFGPHAAAQFLVPEPQALTQTAFRYQLAETDDSFGFALAAADFDGDGLDDLAVSAAFESEESAHFAGAVGIAVGTPWGLDANRLPTLLHTWNGEDDVEPEENFGWALAAGDFDGNGRADLAVGTPDEDSGDGSFGTVNVYYGSDSPWVFDRVQDVAQGRDGLGGEGEDGDLFGFSLAVGNFNGDLYDDLAIGAPGERIGFLSLWGKGAVGVLYGSPEGLIAAFDSFFHQGGLSGGGDSEGWELFGYALAAGDFDGDAYDDLAVGVPSETVDDIDACGAVNVIYGSIAGLDRKRSRFFWQNSTRALGTAEDHDNFGRALAAGDLDGDGRDDLAVGVPFEDIENLVEAGAVDILLGSASGLTAENGLFLHQGTPGVADATEADDHFGLPLLLQDFDRDGDADLFVGIPGENGTGAYQRFWGSPAGLALGTSALRLQPGFGAPEQGDCFGCAMALGDFDGNGRLDLAVGAAGEDIGEANHAGQVDVTYTAPPDVIGPP